jgi:hypothetical protein
MEREVRTVPADWQHPRLPGTYSDGTPRYKGLFGGGFAKAAAEWDEAAAKWDDGFRENYGTGERWVPKDESHTGTYEDWAGDRPCAEDYMPDWPAEQRTHLMMYETCTEGSPISPAFATPEELARWLADNGASAFGSETATYEQWLATIKRGFAVSSIMAGGRMVSGVEAPRE